MFHIACPTCKKNQWLLYAGKHFGLQGVKLKVWLLLKIAHKVFSIVSINGPQHVHDWPHSINEFAFLTDMKKDKSVLSPKTFFFLYFFVYLIEAIIINFVGLSQKIHMLVWNQDETLAKIMLLILTCRDWCLSISSVSSQ